MAKGDTCSIEGCERKVFATKLCCRDYFRKRDLAIHIAEARKSVMPEVEGSPHYLTMIKLSTRVWDAAVFA